ncbi:MAG TPA: hypothetical protein VF610_13470 [Segetibacter sp.]|jgi:hypothetical protein
MGFYKQREEFLQGLCEAHPLVKHNQPVAVDDATPRYSFFRINEEEELEAACKNWIHFPCVVSFDLSGQDVSKDGSIRQRNNNTWLFLTKVEYDPANPIYATALTEAYDTTLSVLMDFKKWIADEYDENGGCGIFRYLDDAFGKWERYGPVADYLYGWILNFNDETRPGELTLDTDPPAYTTTRKVFPFSNIFEFIIPYTPELRSRFGDYPLIEVWLLMDDGKYYKSTSAEIITDTAHPNTTTFTIIPGAGSTGYVSLSRG